MYGRPTELTELVGLGVKVAQKTEPATVYFHMGTLAPQARVDNLNKTFRTVK